MNKTCDKWKTSPANCSECHRAYCGAIKCEKWQEDACEACGSNCKNPSLKCGYYCDTCDTEFCEMHGD